MKKFCLTLAVFCLFALMNPANVFAADVPDFRSVNPSAIKLDWDDDGNYRTEIREWVYKCTTAAGAEKFVKQYANLLVKTGEFTLAGSYRHKESNGTFERYYFIYSGSKRIRQMNHVGSPCSVNVEWTVGDRYVFVSVAAGLTYGNER